MNDGIRMWNGRAAGRSMETRGSGGPASVVWHLRFVPRSVPGGFSLIEVLLATTLSVAMVLMLASATLNTAEQSKRMSDEIDRSGRARLVLDLLVNDLQSMIVRHDENTWLAVDVLADTQNSGEWTGAPGQKPGKESLTLEPAPRDLDLGGDGKKVHPEDYHFGTGGMWLRFVTTAEDRDVFSTDEIVPGDVNTVAYQVIRRRLPGAPDVNDPANAGYQLFRSIVRADHTFDTGYNVDAYKGASVTGQPGEVKSPTPDSVVCDQVIDLGVIIHQRNDDGVLVQGFPRRDSSLPPLGSPLRYRAPGDGIPERIEVMVRIMSPNGARELRWREQTALSPEQWWSLALRESRVYSRTLSLPTAL